MTVITFTTGDEGLVLNGVPAAAFADTEWKTTHDYTIPVESHCVLLNFLGDRRAPDQADFACRLVACNKQTPGKVLKEMRNLLPKDRFIQVQLALLQHPNLPQEVLDGQIAEFKSVDQWSLSYVTAVLNNPKADVTRLNEMAKNGAIKFPCITKGCRTSAGELARAASGRKDLCLEFLQLVMDLNPGNIRAQRNYDETDRIIAHWTPQVEAQEYIFSRVKRLGIRHSLARNPHLDEKLAKKLYAYATTEKAQGMADRMYRDRREVREGLAANTATPMVMLLALARGPSGYDAKRTIDTILKKENKHEAANAEAKASEVSL